MFCVFCGKEINSDAKFCKFCGGNLSNSSAKPIADPVATSAPYVPPIQPPKKPFNPLGWIIASVVVVIIIAASSDGATSTSNNSNSTYTNNRVETPPSVPTRPDYSLPHGTVFNQSSFYMSGDGELEISNGTNYDAVAKLVIGTTGVYSVYIGANRTYTIDGIADGFYELLFAQGSDWNTVTKQFNKNQSYSTFEDVFEFETTEDSQYYYHPTFEVTLNNVIGGTAETSTINPAEFNSF
jgi:hypothetical protein